MPGPLFFFSCPALGVLAYWLLVTRVAVLPAPALSVRTQH
jgi:hypothetical protein